MGPKIIGLSIHDWQIGIGSGGGNSTLADVEMAVHNFRLPTQGTPLNRRAFVDASEFTVIYHLLLHYILLFQRGPFHIQAPVF